MATIPPTPLIPSRPMAGWNIEDESLLMNQQPIFGDDSLLDMTFEMPSEDEDGDEDVSCETVIAPVRIHLEEGDSPANLDMENEDDGDSTCEVPREAPVDLDLDIPSFTHRVEKDFHLEVDQEFDPFDYPPSPFLNSSVYYSKRYEVEVASPLPAVLSDNIPQSNLETVPKASTELSESHHLVASTQVELEGNMLEETVLSARGERPTWAEEEARATSGTLESSMSSSVASGSGSHGVHDKRPASSPHRGADAKKSKPQPRSPSQDDFYARRLSRSASSSSLTLDPTPAHGPSRNSSIGRNTRAGPSRPSSSLRPTVKGQISSPAIRSSSLEMATQVQNDVPPTPLPPPTLLSRLMAKSTVLHPLPPPLIPSTRASPLPQTHETPPEESLASTLIQEDMLQSTSMDIAPAFGTSATSAVDESFGIQPQRGADLGEDIEAPRQLARSSRTPDLGAAAWNLDHTAPEIHDVVEHLLESPDFDQSMELAKSRPASLWLSPIPSPRDSLRRSITTREALSEQERGAPIPPDTQSRMTSSVSSNEGTSLRRSTSQRVIGFISDLLRSSMSSKSTSDLGRSSSSVSIPAEGGEVMSHTQDLDVGMAESMEEVDRGESDHQDHDSMRHSSSDHHSQSPSSSLDHYSNPSAIPGIPPLPKYIPLTRPSKAFKSNTASRIDNPIRHPRPASPPRVRIRPATNFASAALARLPPPGKGSSSSGQKVIVKELERASNIQARRALFEKSTNRPVQPSVLQGRKTTQIDGSTCAEARSTFDRGMSSRLEEKKRLKQVEERERKEREDREYRERRKETVVRARPVPEMYRRKL